MNLARRCSGCGASIDPAARRCSYCGQWNPAPNGGDPGRWIAAWTQGIASEGYSNGSYDVHAYPAMPLSQALQILETLPIPPRVPDPGSYCPPALGFGERNISRMDDGGYFLWPEDRACSLEEAKQVLLQIYGREGAPPR
jgi:hypothetical protein